MAWTTPRSWSTAEVVTAAQMNTHLRDNLNALLHPLVLSGALVDIVNSTTETSLGSFTVPGNTMGSNGLLDILYAGEYRAMRAAGDTVRIRVSYGGTVLLGASATDTILLTTGNLIHEWTAWSLRIRVINLGSTSAQFLIANFDYDTFGGTGGQTTRGVWLQSFGQVAHALPTVDTTADRTFGVTAQLSVANANLEFKKLLLHAQAAAI